MSIRRLFAALAIVVLYAATGALADINPQLIAAVSRRSHGGTNYDVPIGLSGSGAIECRRLSGADTVVLFLISR